MEYIQHGSVLVSGFPAEYPYRFLMAYRKDYGGKHIIVSPYDLTVDRVGAGVGRSAQFDGTTTENLCYGLESGVNFKPNLRFKFHVVSAALGFNRASGFF